MSHPLPETLLDLELGTLDADRSAEARVHLDACADCAGAFRDLEEESAVLHAHYERVSHWLPVPSRPRTRWKEVTSMSVAAAILMPLFAWILIPSVPERNTTVAPRETAEELYKRFVKKLEGAKSLSTIASGTLEIDGKDRRPYFGIYRLRPDGKVGILMLDCDLKEKNVRHWSVSGAIAIQGMTPDGRLGPFTRAGMMLMTVGPELGLKDGYSRLLLREKPTGLRFVDAAEPGEVALEYKLAVSAECEITLTLVLERETLTPLRRRMTLGTYALSESYLKVSTEEIEEKELGAFPMVDLKAEMKRRVDALVAEAVKLDRVKKFKEAEACREEARLIDEQDAALQR